MPIQARHIILGQQLGVVRFRSSSETQNFFLHNSHFCSVSLGLGPSPAARPQGVSLATFSIYKILG